MASVNVFERTPCQVVDSHKVSQIIIFKLLKTYGY